MAQNTLSQPPTTNRYDANPHPDPDILEFAYIGDTHAYGNTADVRVAQPNIDRFIAYCHENPQIQFALYGGDFINSYETNYEQAMWSLRQARNDFSTLGIPFYTTKGNHDCNGKQYKADGTPDNSQIVTDKEYYRLFSPLSPDNPHYQPEGIVTDPRNPTGNYYYRDFPGHRFRLIVLNGYGLDSLETYGVHRYQLKWLAETALDFSDKEEPETWCFLALIHLFTTNQMTNACARLLQAYALGKDFRDHDMGVTYKANFGRQPRARMVALLSGHYHEDIYDNSSGYNLIISHRGYAMAGDLGTYTEICFDHFRLNTRTLTLEKRRIGRGLSNIFSYDKPQMLEPQMPIPNLEGLAAYTRGGRGGRIIRVTHLGDSGEGSLRWAVGQKGCRKVIFDVAGTIRLKSPLVIDHDSLTIYGHASPDKGITLQGAPMIVRSSETVIRYLTLLDGLTDGDFGQHNLVLSHLTVSSLTGDAMSMRRIYRLTVQDCLINGAGPGHAGLVAGGCLSSYIYNHITGCPTAIRFPDEEGCNRNVHVARNLITDWQDHCMTGGGRQGEFTITENYAIPGPMTTNHQLLTVAEDGTGRYYLEYNVVEGRTDSTRYNRLLVNDRSGLPYIPDPDNAAERKKMYPLARPHKTEFARSCLSISPFQSRNILTFATVSDTEKRVRRLAGSGYRPEKVCRDSLLSADMEGYLNRYVHPERTIVILYENDTHGAIDGYTRLAGLREVLRNDSVSVGIVTSGDFLEGSQDSKPTESRAIVEIMNHIGYDAIGLGGHDFAYRVADREKVFGPMASSITCLNLRHIAADTLVYAPYIMRQYDRRSIAFIGVTTSRINHSRAYAFEDAAGQRIYEVSDSNLYRKVQQTVDAARKAGADFVILLSHLGEKENENRISSHSLIAATTGIDVLFDSGNHALEHVIHLPNKKGQPVLLSQTGARLKNVGKLVIDPDGRIYAELIPSARLIYKDPHTSFLVDRIQSAHLADSQ